MDDDDFARREKDELRQTVLRTFWDGEASPSVEVPLGDFFGICFGLRRNFTSSTAYWYQLGRTDPLPPLPPPVEARIPRPDPPELKRR